jgi:hypothetical protein
VWSVCVCCPQCASLPVCVCDFVCVVYVSFVCGVLCAFWRVCVFLSAFLEENEGR